MVNAQKWLDQNYPKEIRKKVTELINISGWDYENKREKNNWEKLEGYLDLKDFTNLEKLDCSYNKLTNLEINNCKQLSVLECHHNQLTNLNLNGCVNLKNLVINSNNLTHLDFLSDCEQLVDLNLSVNFFTSVSFLKTLPCPEKLLHLDMGDNNFASEDLSFLEKFVNLKSLSLWTCKQERINKGIYNCFAGSLEPLKNLNNLETLEIANTDIDSGLEYLENTRIGKILFESLSHGAWIILPVGERKGAKVAKITEQLKPYDYDLRKWKLRKVEEENREALKKAEEKRIVTSLIPIEKLSTTQRDIEKFLSWDSKINEIKDLQQLNKYQWAIGSVQWTGRITSVVGGSLLLVGTQNNDNNYTTTGGVIAIVSPFIEVVTSQLEKNLYEKNKNKWEEFVKDAENFWIIYQDLADVLEDIQIDFIEGKVKEALIDLKEKIRVFSQKYDINEDGEVDDNELGEAKKGFAQDLKDNWRERKDKLEKIKRATKKLQKEVSDYRQEARDKLKRKEKTQVENQIQQTQIQVSPKN